LFDNMIFTNGMDQVADAVKRDFCIAELDKTSDEEEEHKGTIANLEADIEKKEDAVAALTSEINAKRSISLRLIEHGSR